MVCRRFLLQEYGAMLDHVGLLPNRIDQYRIPPSEPRRRQRALAHARMMHPPSAQWAGRRGPRQIVGGSYHPNLPTRWLSGVRPLPNEPAARPKYSLCHSQCIDYASILLA